MKLSLILEYAADINTLLKRYGSHGKSQLYYNDLLNEIGLDDKVIADVNKLTTRAIVNSDLKTDQNYWEQLRKLLARGNKFKPGSYKPALSAALGKAPKDKEPKQPGQSKDTQQPAQQGGMTLGGLLKGAARAYIGAYASVHGIAMPGDNKIPNNVRILDLFVINLGKGINSAKFQ